MANYSTLHASDVSRLESLYGFPLSSPVPLEGGMATSSFTAQAAGAPVVISILDNQDAAGAIRLARTVEHMARHGVPTGAVVPRADGELLATVGGKPVLIKRFIPGRTVKPLPDDLVPAAAELLGRIHNTPADGLEMPVGIRRLTSELRDILGTFPDQGHADWVRRRLRRLDAYFPPTGDPRRDRWALIHGDLTPSNIVVADDSRLYAIDWETVTFDDPMLDCGMSVLNMCVTDNRIDLHRLELFADGYRRSGREFEDDRIRPSVEYAAVIVSFHRYRRHHIRFPNPARAGYYRLMVDFVESEFPEH